MNHLFFEICKKTFIIFRINQKFDNIPSNNKKIDFVDKRLMNFTCWCKGNTEEKYLNLKIIITEPYSSIVQSNLKIYLSFHSKEVIGIE